MRRLMLTLALAALAGPAWAQVEVVSARADHASVVIYRDQPVDTVRMMERAADEYEADALRREGLALIVETRTVDLPAGEAVIRFQDVASGIAPQTALIEGLPGGIVERNADFDLLSPGSLLDRSVGEPVRVGRVNRQTGEETLVPAILRAGAQGPVLEIDGRLEALDCQGLTQRILFDRVPDGLSDQPILSVRTRTPTAGRYTVTLAYLATGLQWSADYVARLNPDGRTLDLSGWITLANFGGSGFTDVPVHVVAGNLNRDEDTAPVEPIVTEASPGCWPMDTTTHTPPIIQAAIVGRRATEDRFYGAKYSDDDTAIEDIVVTGSRIIAKLADLGDYKIYTLPEPTDVNARQTKQVRFLEQDDVRFTRIYRSFISAGDDEEPKPPVLLLRLRNEERDGLGVPMPGGGVTLFESQAGVGLLTGQASFRDKGIGLPVELEFGGAMDVLVGYQTLEDDWIGAGVERRRRYVVEVTVANDKPAPIEIEIAPVESEWPGFRIVQSSDRSVITEGGYPAWRLGVPAGSKRVLRYIIEHGDW